MLESSAANTTPLLALEGLDPPPRLPGRDSLALPGLLPLFECPDGRAGGRGSNRTDDAPSEGLLTASGPDADTGRDDVVVIASSASLCAALSLAADEALDI